MFQTQLRRLCPSQWHLEFMKFSGLSGGNNVVKRREKRMSSLIHGTSTLGSPMGSKPKPYKYAVSFPTFTARSVLQIRPVRG